MKRTIMLGCLALLSGLPFLTAGPSDPDNGSEALTVTYYYLPG